MKHYDPEIKEAIEKIKALKDYKPSRTITDYEEYYRSKFGDIQHPWNTLDHSQR